MTGCEGESEVGGWNSGTSIHAQPRLQAWIDLDNAKEHGLWGEPKQ